MAVYKTDLDYDFLASAEIDEIVTYAKDNFAAKRMLESSNFSFKKRYKVLNALCKMLGITPSNEQWVFLLADCDRLLCEACAGAGKTTMAQLKLVDAKLSHNIPGQNILALAYNRHAVADMTNRHAEIMAKLSNMNIPELKRDRQIMCYTFHKFCKQWVWDYLSTFGYDPNKKNLILLHDSEIRDLMRQACLAYTKTHPDEKLFLSDGIYEALISLYMFSRETLTEDDPQAWKLSSAMNDLKEVPISTIQAIFKFYSRGKKLKKRMDFTDIIGYMWELCQDPAVMRRLRANYSIMLVDEYQDITPDMLRIIRIIMEGDSTLGIDPYYEGQLICIGDGDQSIYGFRGTDPDNCIRFKDAYADPNMMVRITSMSENRRCPSNIIDVARAVITSNDKRIDKPILSIKDGGDVRVHQYSSLGSEMNMLIDELKAIPLNELDDCCICYRNRDSSNMLLIRLLEAGIPVNTSGSCNVLLSDMLSTSVMGVLNMLSYPDNLAHIESSLFKVLPKSNKFKKSTISAMVAEEEKRRQSGAESRRFWEFQFAPEYLAINGFKEAMTTLSKAYSLHRRNANMSEYVPQLIKLVRLYYLNWMMTKSSKLPDDYINYLAGFFSQHISYDAWLQQVKNLRDTLADNKQKGVLITTFHGLKGLEFKRLFVIDLNDLIFPGSDMNISDKLTQAQKDAVENEARRLFYVTITRSKSEIHLYFDEECPTRYIRFFIENQGIAKNYKEYLGDPNFNEEDGFLMYSPDMVDESEDFSIDLGIDPTDLGNPDDALRNFEENYISSNQEATSHFTNGGMADIISQMEESNQRLQQNLGDDQYRVIQDKPHVKSLLDRIMEKT